MNNVSTLPASAAAFNAIPPPSDYINTWDFADRVANANYEDLLIILGCICQHSKDDPRLREAIDNVMKQEAA